MSRLLTSLILCVALTGCGEVVVFGHVVRENPAKAEAAPAKPAAEPAAPEPAVAAATAGSAAPEPAIAAKATEPAAATPARVAAAPAPAAHLLHAVKVTLARAPQTGDASVDAAALLDAIRTELRSRNLLDEHNASAEGTAEVLIEGATTRPTVNAVIFGKQPMAGTLTGELHVSSATGEDLPTSRIVAESRFSIVPDGQDENPLGPLYRRFAVLTADELAGIAAGSSK